MHARLANMANSWQSNEIAEKIRKQKEADMAVLGNRWKNGGIHEEEEVLHRSDFFFMVNRVTQGYLDYIAHVCTTIFTIYMLYINQIPLCLFLLLFVKNMFYSFTSCKYIEV